MISERHVFPGPGRIWQAAINEVSNEDHTSTIPYRFVETLPRVTGVPCKTPEQYHTSVLLKCPRSVRIRIEVCANRRRAKPLERSVSQHRYFRSRSILVGFDSAWSRTNRVLIPGTLRRNISGQRRSRSSSTRIPPTRHTAVICSLFESAPRSARVKAREPRPHTTLGS